MAFYGEFLPALYLLLDQLISWTENGPEDLRNEAGHALAETLRFLSAQQGHWRTNRGFCETEKAFGDKRGGRTPSGNLGWLTEYYVRAIGHERRYAELRLGARGCSAAQRKWLTALTTLRDLTPDTADEWVEIVYQRMRRNAKRILAAPEIRKTPYKSRQYRENAQQIGTMRFGDLRPTIAKAVRALASKPKGQLPGVTRP